MWMVLQWRLPLLANLAETLVANYTVSALKDVILKMATNDVVVVVLLFYVHGKHLRSCLDGQLT